MLTIALLGPCASSPVRCWSAQYRCYVARRDQILGQAAHVLGNARLAAGWLSRPAIGLDRRAPCSLLVDPGDYQRVCIHLTRIEYGVYC